MQQKNSYYAVLGGGSPGVYDSWQDARRHAEGGSSCVVKRFATREEARAFAEAKQASIRRGDKGMCVVELQTCKESLRRVVASVSGSAAVRRLLRWCRRRGVHGAVLLRCGFPKKVYREKLESFMHANAGIRFYVWP